MGFQLSPGVNVSEVDLTGFVPAVATSGAGFVGQFEWGPVLDYTTLENKKVLEKWFGKPTETNYRDWFTCSNFLDYSNNLNIVRVVDEAVALNSDVLGSGILIKNEVHYNLVYGTPTGDASQIVSKYPGVKGDSIRIIIIDSNSYDDVSTTYGDILPLPPSTSDYVKSVGGENDEVHIIIIDAGGLFSGVPNAVLEVYPYLSKASDAKDLDGKPIFYGSVLNKESEYVWFMETPDVVDMATGGAISSVTITDGGSGYDVAPTVAFTDTGSGAGATGTVVLSPTGEVISIDVTSGGSGWVVGETLTITGDGTGATAEVASIGTDDIVTVTVTAGGSGYTTATVEATGNLSGIGAVLVANLGYEVDSVTVTAGGADYDESTTTVSFAPVGTGSGATADEVIRVSADFADTWNQNALGIKFTSLTAKWDKTLGGGAESETVDENELIAGWDMFRNSEVVDVSLLILGDAGQDVGVNSHTTVIKHVVENIAEKRKDCVAFFSPKYEDVVNQPETLATENCVSRRNTINISSSYAFMDSGWKYQYDLYNDKYRWVPLNADIAGVCAQTDLSRDPWWSPAGYTRGQIKNVIKLALNPSSGNRDELYQNNVNPVVSFVGEGVILYGDRTQLTRPSLFQKLNVRRLFIVLEKAIATSSKYQLFDFNDAFTRAQFVSQVEPYLRDVKGRRGISDFRVVCDESNNPGEVVDRSEFVGDIYIKPNNSINYIQLNFVAVRNGVDFNEVVGTL